MGKMIDPTGEQNPGFFSLEISQLTTTLIGRLFDLEEKRLLISKKCAPLRNGF